MSHRPHLRIPTIFLCILCIRWMAFAQMPSATISGTADFAKGEEIRLLVFNDLLNNIPTVVATDKIDHKGRFKLTYSTNQIQLVQLAIRTTKAEFLIAPANNYQFTITTDTALFDLISPDTYGGYLQITSNREDTADLNYKINGFSNYFGRAMDHYGFSIIYDHDMAAYAELDSLLHSKFPIQYQPQNFYLSYLYYTYGSLEKIHSQKDPLKFYNKYFDNDYLLYNNPAYMSLFTQSYTGYLYNSKYISKSMLSKTINERPDYLTLFNEAGRDPLLTNERLRELVIIYNLIEWFGNEEFDQANLVKLLEYIKVSTHFPDHIIFIDNALNKERHILRSELSLTNEKERKVNIKQLEGKNIYIQFFQSDCIDCIREMLILKEMKQKYGNHIQFLSVSIDPKVEQYTDFCQTYGQMFDWPILYFDGSYDWLMENGIETLPAYKLLDDKMNILLPYPPEPEKGLPEYLMQSYPDEEQQQPDNPLFRNHN